MVWYVELNGRRENWIDQWGVGKNTPYTFSNIVKLQLSVICDQCISFILIFKIPKEVLQVNQMFSPPYISFLPYEQQAEVQLSKQTAPKK